MPLGHTHFRSLPEVELHLHLDCSLNYAVDSILRPGLSRKDYEGDFIAPPMCESAADFLTRAPSGFRPLQDREARRVAREELFQQLGEDGVAYAEIRFAPLLHTERGISPEAAVEAVDRAAEEAIRATAIGARPDTPGPPSGLGQQDPTSLNSHHDPSGLCPQDLTSLTVTIPSASRPGRQAGT